MQESGARRAARFSEPMNGLFPRRLAVFLRRTSPLDRIALAILVLYFLLRLARLTGFAFPHPALFAFLTIVCVIYFIGRLLPWVRGRLMWRLRNRLIVAYIFMAVVPVVLLLTMAGVASYLVYLQLGAHLLHDDLQDRIAMIRTDVESIASAVQQENAASLRDNPQTALSTPSVASVIDALKTQWPDLRIYVNRGNELVKAGDSQEFSGLAEFDHQLAFAAVVRRESRGVPLTILAIAPISTELLDRLPSELGPVQLILMQPAAGKRTTGISMEIQDRTYMPQQEISSGKRALGPPANFLDVRVNGASTLEAFPASSADGVSSLPVLASFTLRPSAANRRLFSSVGALGPLLSIILVAASLIFLILELFALVTGVVLTRTITRAVGDLYEATLHVRRGDFSHRVRVHNRDQLGALGESFNEMTSSITELIEDQRQRQRLENEISIAREVQEQLFPKRLPDVPGLALAAVCRAARSVSGDYYDFIRLDENRVGIALADISGKGIFAALLMASLQAALRSQAAMDGKTGTAELVTRLNRHLFLNTSDDRYATFFYGVYDSGAQTLTYTNAGHLAPFLLSDAGCDLLEDGGTVVGLFEEYPYTQITRKIAPGSVLVAFSDGLTEPENVYGEEFGIERLKAEAFRLRHLPPARLVEALLGAAEQWAGTAEQADDMTVVVARMG